jgi:hypothetical protein
MKNIQNQYEINSLWLFLKRGASQRAITRNPERLSVLPDYFINCFMPLPSNVVRQRQLSKQLNSDELNLPSPSNYLCVWRPFFLCKFFFLQLWAERHYFYCCQLESGRGLAKFVMMVRKEGLRENTNRSLHAIDFAKRFDNWPCRLNFLDLFMSIV